MSLPPSNFAALFRAIAVPRLQALAYRHGVFMSFGMEGYAEAHGAVMAGARELGALHLPPDHLTALLDWISAALLREIDAADRRGAVVIERMNAIARETAEYERAFLAASKARVTADA